jgi:hypothetical protein
MKRHKVKMSRPVLAKLLQRRDAEIAEPSAEKQEPTGPSLRLTLRLTLRSLRLCVEIVFLFGSGFAGLGSGCRLRGSDDPAT